VDGAGGGMGKFCRVGHDYLDCDFLVLENELSHSDDCGFEGGGAGGVGASYVVDWRGVREGGREGRKEGGRKQRGRTEFVIYENENKELVYYHVFSICTSFLAFHFKSYALFPPSPPAAAAAAAASGLWYLAGIWAAHFSYSSHNRWRSLGLPHAGQG